MHLSARLDDPGVRPTSPAACFPQPPVQALERTVATLTQQVEERDKTISVLTSTLLGLEDADS